MSNEAQQARNMEIPPPAGASTSKRQSLMSSLAEELDQLRTSAKMAREKGQDIRDTLCGPPPTAESTVGEDPPVQGILGQVRDAVSEIHAQIIAANVALEQVQQELLG